MADVFHKKSNAMEETDITFKVGSNPRGNVRYNVSKFLREHKFSDADIDKLINFIRKLDKHIHVDKDDPRYSQFYRGIDIIMKRVVSELAKANSYFSETKLRLTGSIHSGVKVGLPHEADYLFDVLKNNTIDTGTIFKNDTLYRMVLAITAYERASLTEGLDHCGILGVKQHKRIGGICLVMECPSIESSPDSKQVGVTVDSVPAHVLKSTRKSLTILIENQIIKGLPESKKQVFRVLKFLNQNIYSGNFTNRKCDNRVLDEKSRLYLYGYKHFIPSYRLRAYFIHLLLHVDGTQAEEELSDGRLLLCHIDMLKGSYIVNMDHPIIERYSLGFYVHHLFREKFTSVLAKMQSFTGEVSLLNSENHEWLEAPECDEPTSQMEEGDPPLIT